MKSHHRFKSNFHAKKSTYDCSHCMEWNKTPLTTMMIASKIQKAKFATNGQTLSSEPSAWELKDSYQDSKLTLLHAAQFAASFGAQQLRLIDDWAKRKEGLGFTLHCEWGGPVERVRARALVCTRKDNMYDYTTLITTLTSLQNTNSSLLQAPSKVATPWLGLGFIEHVHWTWAFYRNGKLFFSLGVNNPDGKDNYIL